MTMAVGGGIFDDSPGTAHRTGLAFMEAVNVDAAIQIEDETQDDTPSPQFQESQVDTSMDPVGSPEMLSPEPGEEFCRPKHPGRGSIVSEAPVPPVGDLPDAAAVDLEGQRDLKRAKAAEKAAAKGHAKGKAKAKAKAKAESKDKDNKKQIKDGKKKKKVKDGKDEEDETDVMDDKDDVQAKKGTPESKVNRRKRAKVSPKVTPKKRRVRKNLQKDFDQASDAVEKLMGSPKVKALAAKRRKDQAKIALKMLHESKLVGLEVPLELDRVLLDFIYNQTGV